MKGKVLIAAPVHPVLTKGLQDMGYEPVMAERITQAEGYRLIGDCVGVITSTRLRLDRQLLDAAPALRWIGRMGSGMEVIDLEYARQKGITAFGSPEGNRNAVAEHTLGLLLSLNRKIASSRAEVATGQWLREENRGTELEGRTIGIIGFGHTGRAFARKLQGFDMRILAYDVSWKQPAPEYVTACTDLEPIFSEAEIISFHVPLTGQTENYFNQKFLQKITQDITLLNTSRGEIVVTEALISGLATGKIKAAGLDVWREEPMERMSTGERQAMEQVLAYPQVIITPHIAGYTHEALYKMSRTLLDKLVNKQII